MPTEVYDSLNTKFDAVLRTPGGQIIETGRAQYDAANNSVDFEGSFVPLYAMGTRLEIVRVYDGVMVHRFTGEVYLSSADMLRLVSVQAEVLPEAALVFLYSVDFQGTAKMNAKVEKRFLFASHTVEKEISFPVKAHALSVREIKFNTDLSVELDPGQKLTLYLRGDLGIPAIPVEVRQAIVFGQEANSYRCRILPLGPMDEIQLKNYVREISLAAARQSL